MAPYIHYQGAPAQPPRSSWWKRPTSGRARGCGCRRQTGQPRTQSRSRPRGSRSGDRTGSSPTSRGRGGRYPGPRGCLCDHRIVGPVVRDGEISDAAWAGREPLLPPVGKARGRWRDHHQVLEGIVFKFRTGLPWRDLPEWFGPWQTVHGRFARWTADGAFDRLLTAVQTRAEVDWLVAIDSTIVRAHQHADAKEGLKNADSDAPAAG
ncbi:IS5 family transposase [Streptomyces sp. NPDC056191]|uniref:IS5 family transposase n=1 Tax=Streptomyces sp. NPDC056191 TaxID=3345742 RepID=UPI0035DF6A88